MTSTNRCSALMYRRSLGVSADRQCRASTACDITLLAHVTTLAEAQVSDEASQQLLVHAAVHCLGEGSGGSQPLR